MTDPDSIILELLRSIRSEMSEMRNDIRKLDEKVDDLNVGQQSMQGVMMAVGHSLYVLDHRVEAVEQKLGGDQ
jgi:hypothetical protein